MNVLLSGHGLDLQGGYALTDHFAATGSWYGRWEKYFDEEFHTWGFGRGKKHLDSVRYKRNLLSFGLAYFTKIDKKKRYFFNVAAGYGAGRFLTIERAKTKYQMARSDTMILEKNFYCYKANMSRFFIQPAVIHDFYNWQVMVSIRWAGTIYHHVHTSGDPDKYGTVSNKILSFIEPAMTWKIAPGIKGLTINVQMGASINTGQIDYDYHPFIGNIGLAIDPIRIFSKKSTVEEKQVPVRL